jgi:hypothetical protein
VAAGVPPLDDALLEEEPLLDEEELLLELELLEPLEEELLLVLDEEAPLEEALLPELGGSPEPPHAVSVARLSISTASWRVAARHPSLGRLSMPSMHSIGHGAVS